MRELFQLACQAHGIAGVTLLKRGEFHLGLLFIVQGAGAFTLGFGGLECAGVFNAHGAFGHGDDAEIGAIAASAFDGLGNS